MLTLRFPAFRLEHCPSSGLTSTVYPDGERCDSHVVDDDSVHADELGIMPGQHRLVHELWHHIVGIHIFHSEYRSSPVIWRQAHGQPHPTGLIRYTEFESTGAAEWELHGWKREEWLVTALSHAYFGHAERDYGAREYLELELRLDVLALMEIFTTELNARVELTEYSHRSYIYDILYQESYK